MYFLNLEDFALTIFCFYFNVKYSFCNRTFCAGCNNHTGSTEQLWFFKGKAQHLGFQNEMFVKLTKSNGVYNSNGGNLSAYCFEFHFFFCIILFFFFFPLQQAEQLGREDQQRLHRNRKLVLMVDLDQTLIHTTEQHCQHMSRKVRSFLMALKVYRLLNNDACNRILIPVAY